MPTNRPRTVLSGPAGLAAALLTALVAAPLHAQESGPDTRAPVIEIEILNDVVANTSQVFSAQVADDRELVSVTLHHRREGDSPFARAPMRPIGASGYYGVTIPTDPADLSAIEYYVQAIDDSGNRTVNGFAFDPLRRTLAIPPTPFASSAPPVEETPRSTSGRTRWWAVALGVVAVGALASLAGGSDGGGGDGNVPLTIDVPRPGSR